MSIRGVWVIRRAQDGAIGGEQGKDVCLFSRRYPTIERRAKLSCTTVYSPIPSDNDLLSALSEHNSSRFTAERDSCVSAHSPPVYEFIGLWPVVTIERSGIVFMGVPLVTGNTSGLQLLAVPSTLTLLESMAHIVSGSKDECVKMLSEFLYMSAPFGTPLDLAPSNTTVKLQQAKGKPLPIDSQKQPSWRLGVYRGFPKVSLCVCEEVKAMLYDKQEIADTWDLSGTLTCKAEVEGSPDIQVTLTTPTDRPELDNVLVHPIVHSGDAHQNGANRKLRFSASLESVELVHYQCSLSSSLPIRGFYQMKGDSSVRLLVQLKLNETVRNNFEYCEVHIPFFNRGSIDKVDSIVPVTLSQNLALSADRKIIIWNIGQKFPVKGLELSLQATVHFKESTSEDDSPFYVGSNSYIEILFKVLDFTLSGCSIDPKSVTLFPSAKPKITISRELVSSNYRIWNSHGDVIATYPQL